jgi:hypothetical protein
MTSTTGSSGCRTLAALLLFLWGCQAPPPFDAEATRREVSAYFETIPADLAREGPTGWLTHFEDSPGFFMAVGGKLRFRDNDSAEVLVRRSAPRIRAIDLAWHEVRVDPITPSLAQVGASFFEIVRDTAGSEIRYEGYLTALAERRAGRWRLRNLHWSLPGADE